MGCCQYHMLIAFGHTLLSMFDSLDGETENQRSLIESIRGLARAMESSLTTTTRPRGQA